MKKLFLSICLLLIVLSQGALAFETFTEEIQIHEDLSSTFLIEGTTGVTNKISFELPLESTISILQIDGVDQIQNCETQETASAMQIICIVDSNHHTLFVKSKSSYPIIKSDHSFFVTIDQSLDFESATVKLTLPEGSLLSEERTVSPEVSNKFTIAENQVLLWRFANSNQIQISFLATNPKKSSLKIIVSVLVLFAILSMSVYLKFFKTKNTIKKNSNKHDVEISKFDHLLENEKLVIDSLMKSSKGFLWQKELEIQTKLPKVKLSRTLRRMQERNIIKKEPFGNTNKISLAKK